MPPTVSHNRRVYVMERKVLFTGIAVILLYIRRMATTFARFACVVSLIALCIATGAPITAISQENAAIRYETALTKHLTLHQEYPNSARLYGLEGDVLLRIQVDKDGYIPQFYFIKEAGHPILDKSVIAMLQQAQPVPKPPKTILSTSGTAEFLFPIAFRTAMDKGSLFQIDQLFRSEAEKAWKEADVR